MFLSRRIRAALARDRRLLAVLEAELAAAEGCEGWRQLAESLLAQVASARAVDGGLLFTDYYADPPAQTRIECDRGETAQQVAERLFRRYRKARRRIEAASQRVPNLAQRIAGLEELEKRVEASGDDALDNLEAEAVRLIGIAPARRQDPAAVEAAPAGMRRFVTSDGFEVLVGRTAAANDRLTFRIAKASDLWLHAADYPGSHVIVRNPSRQQIPERTIREAASIAAFYSQAGRDALVDVRCCERRYVTKPKRAATGLVRLSRFRTIAVRPARGRDETPDEEER
jgi:predicted ribosome quality control (RQC) complex YloA/Tae2 family protein